MFGKLFFLSTILLVALSRAQTATTVTEGTIIDGSIDGDGYAYYVLQTISPGPASLTISVTPFSGDPDMYVSQNVTQPRQGNSTWSARNIGGDDVTIPVGQLDMTKPIYIAVHGFGGESSTFTLAVYRSALTVRPGSPQSGTVGANQDNFFKFPHSSDTDHVTVVLSAEMFYGLRLYINGIPAADELSSYPTGPSYQPRQWESNYDFPRRAIIRRGDVGFCGAKTAGATPPANTQCNLYITVHGSSYMFNATVFTVTASTSADVVRLQPGESMYDIVPASSYDYFTVAISRPADISFSLTAISGNPNMYISTTNPRPTSAAGNFTWKSDFYGTDAIEISATDPNFKVGTYYIAVGGSANSYFLLEVGYANASTSLYPGTPVVDHLNAGQYRHYSFPVQVRSPSDITIAVTSIRGTAPYVLVNVADDGYPTGLGTTGATWDDLGFSGLATVTIHPADPKYCSTCTLYITVREGSAVEMDYTIVATINSESTILLDGVPQVGKLAGGQWAYYVFTLNLAQAVNVQVTRTSGDPDIYVSRVDRYPYFNATWVANDIGSDAVQIPTSDPAFCSSCDYYVGIYAFEESEYTVLAYHSNTTTSVRAGVPYEVSNSSAGVYTYFDINVADTSSGITFTTTPTTGYPYMFISTAGIPDPATPAFPPMWTASGYPATVTIGAGDANRCSNCRYYIAIGSRYSPTSYSFQVRTGNAAQELAMGTPFYGDIPNRGFAYFFCRFPDATSAGSIEVTSFAGDPDIFVSRNVTAPTDAPGSHTWSGTNFGADLVVIPAADIASCRGCNYYIGVQNYHDTRLRFTITASQRGEIMTLFEGTPQQDTLARNQTRRIVLTVNQAGRVTVTLSSEVGVPSVFMTSREPNGLAEWPSPRNRTSYQWSSAVGNPVVIVAASGDVGFCTASPCKYYLTVMPRDPASTAGLRYTIAASAGDQQVTLQLRRPQIDNVQPQRFRYYVFYPEDVTESISVSVTTLSGDPDLYVSRTAVQPGPGAGNFTWKGEMAGDDTLVINPRSDTRACQAADASSCVYYIGVKNFHFYGSSSYTVLVSQPGRFIELLNGVPQDGIVTKGASEMALFSIVVPDSINDRFQITVTPRRGIPDLFVGTLPVSIDRANVSTYGWSSTHGLPVIVTIHPDHSKFCAGCSYYIGVAAGANSTDVVSFSILAVASNTTITLRPGRPQIGSVVPGSIAYFQAAFPIKDDVHISVTPLAGRSEDPDVLVSCARVNPQPSWFNFTWIGAFSGADEVIIRARDSAFCEDGDVFVIGITDIVETDTREAVSFIVTVFQTEGFSILQDGLPMVATLSTRTSVRHYQFAVDDDAAINQVSFQVTPTQGAPALYVATSEKHPSFEEEETFPIPGNATTTDRNSTARTPSVVVTFDKGDGLFCSKCTYFITVGSDTTANITASTTSYTITASTSRATITLQTGVATQSRTRPSAQTKFFFDVPVVDNDVTISASLTAGNADMYVSVVGSATQWTVLSLADQDTLTIPKAEVKSECQTNCRLSIVVVGAPWPNSTSVAPIDFVITASLAADVLMLTPGTPVVAPMGGQSTRRFKLFVPSGSQYLTLSATAPAPITIMVNKNLTAARGSSTENFPTVAKRGAFNSPADTATHVSLSTADLASAQYLYILVSSPVPLVNSSVYLLAAFADSTIQLKTGTAGFASIKAGTLMRFVADFGNPSSLDNVLNLQAFHGSAVVLVTYSPLDPLLDTKWRDAVSVDPKDPLLASREIVIAPDSAECKEASAGARSCDVLVMDVKALTDADISITPSRPDGTPFEVIANVEYTPQLFENVWSTYRIRPFYKKRLVTFTVSAELKNNVYLLLSRRSKPPTATPELYANLTKVPSGYDRAVSSGSRELELEANQPYYFHVGSPAKNQRASFKVIDVEDLPAPNPVTSTSPSPDNKGLSGAATAVIIIATIFGLVAMVGCFVFFTRFDTIRRMYKATSKKSGYAEVQLG